MGHMKEVSPSSQTPSNMCYLPHHGVWRLSSSTTKLRVVYNGSWRLPNGATLNENLRTGHNLLPGLPDVLLRCRTHLYVIATDVEKMYRQILVHPNDRDFQRILWRPSPSDKIKEYRLNTMTYGTACAPFLTLRTIKQLATDYTKQHTRKDLQLFKLMCTWTTSSLEQTALSKSK
ncbi:uncharacterized protein [Venturia canescens]|uniref:uncharacterized protein n=1 Tax=Venturia canescens TaxID=32260 RepID=UPI001C9D6077|nr:uncharacterized protein LOC122411344 [Venturia canescens]